MHSFRPMWLVQRASILTAVAVLTAGAANAQFARSDDSSGQAASTDLASTSESSSAAAPTLLADGADGMAAMPAAPSSSGSGAGQNGGYGENGGYGGHRSFLNALTWEAGGGFNAPVQNSLNDITWGYNFNLGAGYQFNRRLSALIEYQFIHDKLPGQLIADVGATGGYANIWSFTIDPVVDLFPKKSNDIYVTGGGGFYRKVTSFTDPEPAQYCTYFYCGIGYFNTVVGHFSSNQGGWNVGAGFQHRLGGMYGDSRMKLFAEARYLKVLTPAVNSSPNGLGVATLNEDTTIIPVTFGVRW
jgi:hypothetical protein